MVADKLPNVKVVKDRKGAPRYYFQVKGRPLIRLPNGPTNSAEFLEAWEAARVVSNVNDEPNQLVSVNGVNYLLPRGKKSKVPPEVAYEFKRAQEAQEAFDAKMDEMLAQSQEK